MVGKKIPYKFPNDIASKFFTLLAINRQFVCQPKNGQLLKWPKLEDQQTGKILNFSSTASDKLTPSCKFMGQNSEILGGKKNSATFWHLKNQHFSAHQMANQWPWYVEQPPLHLWTESWSSQSMCHTTPPPKMVLPYSLGTWPPKTPKAHWGLVAPSLRKNWFSEDTQFWLK